MFTSAFLEQRGQGKLGHEERLLREEFERRGVPVTLFTAKQIRRRVLPLSAETFVAGDVDAMHGAMKQLNIEIPAPKDYPNSLLPFMYRPIWESTLGEVERRIVEGDAMPIFAKPADRKKSFTGRVFGSMIDFAQIGRTSRRQRAWCSPVVSWITEYRVYINGADIVSIDNYAGDANIELDRATLDAAVSVYRSSGEAPAAYALDFGVLSSGETALVEANDAYALGAYAISAGAYTDLLVARWQQLLYSR